MPLVNNPRIIRTLLGVLPVETLHRGNKFLDKFIRDGFMHKAMVASNAGLPGIRELSLRDS